MRSTKRTSPTGCTKRAGDHINRELAEGDPVKKIGLIAAHTLLDEQNFSEAAGVQIPQEMLFALGEWTVEELYEIADKQGIYRAADPQQEQVDMGSSLNHAVSVYVSEAKNRGREIDTQAAQQLGQEIAGGAYDNIDMMGGQQVGA